jgi:hypothetical protein
MLKFFNSGSKNEDTVTDDKQSRMIKMFEMIKTQKHPG